MNKGVPTLILSNNTAAVNTSGLVGYWRFENESLGTATDYSGWNNTGTLTNMNNAGSATSGPTAGRFGGGMQFDGSNDYVNAGNSASLNTPYITVSAWIYRQPSINNYARIVSKYYYYQAHKGSWVLYFDITKAITFTVNVSGTFRTLLSGQTVSQNTWTHVVGVYNGSNLIIYVNGQPTVSPTYSGTIGATNYNWTIGASFNGTNSLTQNIFNGTMDEVQIWNRSLTADEINELYQSSTPYFTQTNFTCSANTNQVSPSLFRNTTNVTATENGILTTLNIGYYYYFCNASSTQNYTTSAMLLPLRITCEPPTSGNWTIPSGIDCSCNSTWTPAENLHVYGALSMLSNCNIIFTPSGKSIYVYPSGTIYQYPGAGFNKPS
jgi:hypothetical protein